MIKRDDPALQRAVQQHLAGIIDSAAAEFNALEIETLLDGMTSEGKIALCLLLIKRIASMRDERRLEAERDGWREIAKELLAVALGTSDFDLPPIEIVQHPEAKRVGTPLLAQFWHDLTRKHDEDRVAKTTRDLEPLDRRAITLIRDIVMGAAHCASYEIERGDDGVDRSHVELVHHPRARRHAVGHAIAGIAAEEIRSGDLIAMDGSGRVMRADPTSLAAGEPSRITVTSANPINPDERAPRRLKKRRGRGRRR